MPSQMLWTLGTINLTSMDETIHIYLDNLFDSERGPVSVSKKRLWPSIIISIRWIFKNPITGRTIVQNGLGLMLVNSLAIAVEGFIGDILVEYIDDHQIEKSQRVKTIENSNWKSKVKIYNKTFENKLMDCASFEAIDVLFALRNNTSHGRTHREISVMLKGTPELQEISSVDKDYQKAREFFKKLGLLKEDRPSNVEKVWQISHVHFLLTQVESFFYSVIEKNKSKKFDAILSELNNAFKMTL